MTGASPDWMKSRAVAPKKDGAALWPPLEHSACVAGFQTAARSSFGLAIM